MDNINGIPVIRVSDVIKPVLSRYGRSANDIAIRIDIISDLQNAIDSDDIALMRQFLSQSDSFWLGNLQHAYFQPFEGVEPLSCYAEWAAIKCKLRNKCCKMT